MDHFFTTDWKSLIPLGAKAGFASKKRQKGAGCLRGFARKPSDLSFFGKRQFAGNGREMPDLHGSYTCRAHLKCRHRGLESSSRSMAGSFHHFIDDRYLLQNELIAFKTKEIHMVELHHEKGLLLRASIGGVVSENLLRKNLNNVRCAVGLYPNPLLRIECIDGRLTKCEVRW